MNYRYFENRNCEFYPCHKSAQINCLFCFCPLYHLPDCGGDFRMIVGKEGKKVKDCSDCLLPHTMFGYDFIVDRLKKENSNMQHFAHRTDLHFL